MSQEPNVSKIQLYRSKTTVELETFNIEHVEHGLSTLLYPVSLVNPVNCPVCRQQIRKQTGHGKFIETCSIIKVAFHAAMPIHTDCYHNLKP